jgi:hypothetical protein
MPQFVLAHRTQLGANAQPEAIMATPELIMLASNGVEILRLALNLPALTLNFAAQPGLLHYFRLADATLLPLPPEHAPARHKLAPGLRHEPPLRFSAGDAYIAVSPGVAHLADSPALARFLHLRDYFNAEKLCAALLAHLEELAGGQPFPEAVTVLVVEAR